MKFIVSQALYAVLSAVLGIVLIVNPGGSADAICTVLGVCALVAGAAQILLYLLRSERHFPGELVTGIVLAVVGLLCLAAPRVVMSVLPLLLGIILIIDGAGQLSRSMEAKKLGYSHWSKSLVLAILVIALGAALLVNPFGAVETAVTVFGICVLVDGILDLIFVLRTHTL